VQRASGIPCALFSFEGEEFQANLGRIASRECEPVSAVIARSEATKQSILSLRGEMDCFASLAMTVPLFEIRIRLQPISLHRAR
jgi:hypothetical protein